jgi:RNA polymerase sigma factor (TIGR02999 family)
LSGTPAEVTQILHDWSAGDGSAPERLIPLVYDELRRLAQSYLQQERTDHTLQATALVHEAYLRMVDQTRVSINSRAHFFGVAAHLMRQILVDHARAHGAQKRGGAADRLALDEARFEPEHQAGDLLALDEALVSLAQTDERKSKVVEMRFFGGLAEKEIAVVLDVSEKTVARDWQVAKLWLYRELSEESN